MQSISNGWLILNKVQHNDGQRRFCLFSACRKGLLRFLPISHWWHHSHFKCRITKSQVKSCGEKGSSYILYLKHVPLAPPIVQLNFMTIQKAFFVWQVYLNMEHINTTAILIILVYTISPIWWDPGSKHMLQLAGMSFLAYKAFIII